MDAARWATLQTLLHDALDLPADARAAFVARHAPDPALAAELAALLAAADAVPAFLDAPPAWSLGGDGAAPDLAGTTIGPYRLVRELGRGGQGRVFLAERDDVGTRVALKLVRGGLAAPDLVPRFLTERRVLAGLDHPHIARLLDAGTTAPDAAGERTPYLVMEAVDGEPLTDFVAAHRPPLDERLRLFGQVCAAVQFAHGRLVVHRDLKPSNILVGRGPDGAPAVKLLDFGIAKLLSPEGEPGGRAADADAALTQTGHRLLTPAYAAPEQVLGEPVTVATDVYALGVLLYELLADARPYAASGSLRDVVRDVCDERPPPPSARAADPDRARALRGDLDTIALKALQKAPADRYASAEALADDLHRYARALPIRARAQTAGYRLSRFLRRHAVGAAVAVLAVALAAGFVVRERVLRGAAEAARDESLATAELLLDVFGISDDGDGSAIRADTLRAEALLDRASRRLAARLDDRPRLKGLLTLQLGRIYAGLGIDRTSIPRFGEAVRLLREAGGDPDLLAGALHDLGTAQFVAGRCREGLATLDEALRHHRLARSDEQVEAATVTVRGAALGCLGRYDAAVAAARQAQAVYDRDPGDLGFNLHTLADFLQRAGRHDEALAAMRASVDRAVAAYPRGHPVVTARRVYLSRLCEQGGDLATAEREARRAYTDSRAGYGESERRTVGAALRLVHVLRLQQRLPEAAAVSGPLVGLARRTADPYTVGQVLHGHALVLLDTGRPAEAEAHVREALAASLAFEALYRPHRVDYLRTLGEAQARQGRAPEAAAAAREAEALEAALAARRTAPAATAPAATAADAPGR